MVTSLYSFLTAAQWFITGYAFKAMGWFKTGILMLVFSAFYILWNATPILSAHVNHILMAIVSSAQNIKLPTGGGK